MSRLHIFLALSAAAALLLLAVPTKRGASDGAAGEPGDARADTSPRLPTIDVVAPARPDKLMELQRDRRAASAWGRDPFEDPSPPLVAEADPVESGPDTTVSEVPEVALEAPTEPPSQQPQLTGISRSGTRRWAIIDREIVQEGDALPSGYRISRIDEHSVTVMRDRESVVLNMGDAR